MGPNDHQTWDGVQTNPHPVEHCRVKTQDIPEPQRGRSEYDHFVDVSDSNLTVQSFDRLGYLGFASGAPRKSNNKYSAYRFPSHGG